MTPATDIQSRVAEFLGAEVEAEVAGQRIALLTPAEYPDGDGVVVWISQRDAGTFEVTDLGESDSRLLADGPGQRAVGPAGSSIAHRFGLRFEGGTLIARATVAELPETCWRVAQAASALAEAVTFHRPTAPKEAAFVDLVGRELRQRRAEVNTDVPLEGASGHTYTASLFVPAQHTVIEPVAGEQAWNKATAVYVEFGDLSRVNGFNLLAIVDDRDDNVGQEVEGLLAQVASVARWSRRSRWVETVLSGRLV